MKKVVIVLMLVLALTLSMVPSFAENGTELLGFDVDPARLAGDTWTVAAGQFCGPLYCPDNGQFEWEAKDAEGVRVYPTKEVTVDGDRGVYRFAIEAETGMLSYGNYYGIMDVVQPNTTYTAILTYKCTPGSNPGYEANLAEIILGYSEDAEAKLALTLNSEDYVTSELVFTTGDSVASASLIVGPNGFTAMQGAGYELLVANLELYEGDVTASEAGPVITLNKSEYASGEEIIVTLNDNSGREYLTSDWIGVYFGTANEESMSGADSLGIWCYAGSGTRNYGGAPAAGDTVTIDSSIAEPSPSQGGKLMWPLAPGEYKVMLLYDDGYTVGASATFTVVENTETGDAGIAAVIVLAVALLATVVFTKKKVFGI